MNIKDLSKLTELDAIYKALPTIECKGLCYESCGPIAYSGIEAKRIEANGGEPPSLNMETTMCSQLTQENRCAIYNDRPLLCRLYGITRKLACPHGCVPSEWKNDQENMELFGRLYEMSDGQMLSSLPVELMKTLGSLIRGQQ